MKILLETFVKMVDGRIPLKELKTFVEGVKSCPIDVKNCRITIPKRYELFFEKEKNQFNNTIDGLGIVNDEDELNGPWTIFLRMDNKNIKLDGRPINHYGVHGLIEHNKEIYLLEENDNSFITLGKLSKDEMKHLREQLIQVSYGVEPFLNNPTFINERLIFECKQGTRMTSIDLMIDTKHSLFDIGWLSELIQVLQIGLENSKRI